MKLPWTAIDSRYDLYSAGFLFNEILSYPGITHELSGFELQYLQLLAKNMMEGFYTEITHALADFNKLDVSMDTTCRELSDYPKNMLRIPELISVSFTPRVRALINHPFFSRLQNIKQLSLCYFVYPGAMHTRYEHSLGVYSYVCKYINSLLCNTERFKFIMCEEDILSLLIASLCHDLGQYPFAHAFEDIDYERYSHEKYTKRLLLLSGERVIPGFEKETEDFHELLRACSVNVDNLSSIFDPRSSTNEKKYKILKAIIDGPVDADKLDYLTRDSIHTGVLYGRFLDRDRFLQSLTIDDNASLALTHKGRISAELFAFCRYAMFSEVYWHKTVRALHSMISCAIEKYTNEVTEDEFAKFAFRNSDEYFLDFLCQSKTNAIAELAGKIRLRKIYQEIASVRNDDTLPEMKTMYENISEKKWQHKEQFTLDKQELVKQVRVEFKLDNFDDHHLIIDVPNPKKDHIGYINIVPETAGLSTPISTVSPLWTDISRNFETWVRRIRFYIDESFVGYIDKKQFLVIIGKMFGN